MGGIDLCVNHKLNYNAKYVTRMGLEPMTPTLKVLCSTS